MVGTVGTMSLLATATGGSDAAAESRSSASNPDGDPGSLTDTEIERLKSEIARLYPDLDPVAVDSFLREPSGTRSAMLAEAGLDDPGGSLANRAVQEYLSGQWLQNDGDSVRGAMMIARSSVAPVGAAEDAIASLVLDDFVPTSLEIDQTVLATGLASGDARRRAQLQLYATHLRPTLERSIPGYAGLWISADNRSLVLAGSDKPSLDRAVTELSLEGVATRQTAWSREQLAEFADSVTSALRGMANNWSVAVNPLTESIEVSIDPKDDDVESQLDNSSEVRDVRAAGVEVQIIRERAVRPALAMQGGRNATSCTWGFSVENSGDPHMIVTAAHCGNTQAQQGVNLAFIKACQGNIQGCANPESDAQLHQVPNASHTAENEVRLSSGAVVDITGVVSWSAMDVNDNVCHQGMTTGYSCGIITNKNVSQSLTPGSNQFVTVKGSNLRSQGGDSGGPFIWGNNAYGLLSTSNVAQPPNNLANFGAISFAETNLVVSVKIK